MVKKRLIFNLIFQRKQNLKIYRQDIRRAIRREVNKAIKEKKSNQYMMSRFLLIRCLDPYNEYKLFDGEEWFFKCQLIEEKVFKEVFKIKEEDMYFMPRHIEMLWAGNELADELEKLLEQKLLEYSQDS